MAILRERFLGQVTPDGSLTAVAIVSPAVNTTKIVKNIFVNNRGAAAEFDIYHANVSSSSSATTTKAIYWKEAVSATTTKQLSIYLPVESTAGAVLVRSSSPNNITFTAYGAEVIESPYNLG